MSKKILFIDNTAHHLYGQMHLVHLYKRLGYSITAIIPDDNNYFLKIKEQGVNCYKINIAGKSLNPLNDLKLMLALKKIINKISPDLINSFTIKPNIYAAIIARQQKIPIIVNVTGLGYVFLKGNWLSKFVSILYKFAFYDIPIVFFQNNDDRLLLTQAGIFSKNTITSIVPGSGVDIQKFNYIGLDESHDLRFLFSGRLLWDKGLGELIEAFQIVKKKYPYIELVVIGNYYPGNPAAISEEQMDLWQRQYGIKYLGMVDNVPEQIAASDCIVLPSYREGMPRAILEASSMGKAVIAADVPGCRDAVDDMKTGFLCKVKDIQSLADAMIRFIELSFEEKLQMGINGRKKMEQEFDQAIVINKYLEVSSRLLC